MAKQTTYTREITEPQAAALRAKLESLEAEFQDKPYCLYAAKRPGVNVAVYEKGPKIVVQGKETEAFVTDLLEPEILGVAELGYDEVHHPERYEAHIGVDESGKGDFLGPLVIAGVYADPTGIRDLVEAGAVDSKRLSSDARVRTLAKAIRSVKGLRHEVIVVGPERYNDLYDKMGNLNRMLAWGHARVIELLLERVPDCPRAVSDQFARPEVLQRALQEKGRGIELVQRTKAESDPVVAAASILAREGFVDWLERTGESYGIELPKGVSGGVKQAAQQVVDREGMPELRKIAKMHFRTSQEIRQ